MRVAAIPEVFGRIGALTHAELAAERALAADVRIDRILADVAELTKAPRTPGSAGYEAAAKYVVEQATDAGWAVRVERQRIGPWMNRNIIIERSGIAPDAERGVVVGTAHLDTVRGTPGANDNAAAVASVLEAVRALSDSPTLHDVKFVLVDREEQGLIGTRAFIASARNELRGAKASLNIEMPGAPNQTHAGFSLGQRTGDGMSEEIHRVATRHGIEVEMWGERTMRTDNRAFDNAGVPNAAFGVKFGNTFESTKRLDPHYHGATDTIEHLNTQLVHDHARLFTLTMHDIAAAPGTVTRTIRSGAAHDMELRMIPYMQPVPLLIGFGGLGAAALGAHALRSRHSTAP